jgi:hypothetical protein
MTRRRPQVYKKKWRIAGITQNSATVVGR